jgi:hypothetical protein
MIIEAIIRKPHERRRRRISKIDRRVMPAEREAAHRPDLEASMIERRVGLLERQVRILRAYAALMSVLVAILALSGFNFGQAADVLRVRGLIIEDSLGRERILLGAPVPQAQNRVRTDMARVGRIWGPRFPEAYVQQWYPQYRHDMNGMLVLDSNGFDRVAIGHDVPDPNIGRRIARGTGILINDTLGFERSGYSLLTVDGKDRVVIGLDYQGGEALTLVVDDAGRVGLLARDGNRSVYLGRAAIQDSIGTSQPVFGLLVRDGQRVVHRVAADITPDN